SFALDEVAISGTQSQLTAANPHAVATTLSTSDFDDLLRYLLEQDGRPSVLPTVEISGPGNGSSVDSDFIVTGTTAANGNVQTSIALNSDDYLAVDGDSEWSFAVSVAALGVGWHTITVRVLDIATGTTSEVQQQFYRAAASEPASTLPKQVPLVPWQGLVLVMAGLILIAQRVQRKINAAT
ncbi:MAG: Ig-like domain-containing protein, partial [Pseudomonadota bacterium]